MLTVREDRPRLIGDLSPDIANLIEDVTADSKGRDFVTRQRKPFNFLLAQSRSGGAHGPDPVQMLLQNGG
jgi:hypothetical protein